MPVRPCLQGESRLLRDEVHRLTLELRERQLALEKLRAKYETLAARSRTADGGGAALPSLQLFVGRQRAARFSWSVGGAWRAERRWPVGSSML